MQESGGATRTHARFLILGLVTFGTLLNYLDRGLLSVASKPLSTELGLNAAVMGVLFSAFSWTYAASQIPGGILLDKLGVRKTYSLSLTLWSLFTFLQGFAGGLLPLMTLRLGLGIAEAPCYPANSRILNMWFPQSERARATGVYSIGQYGGAAFFSPLMFWVVAQFGWRSLFLIVGVVGIVYGLIWWLGYRDPTESRRLGEAERAHIQAGGGFSGPAQPQKFEWRNIFRLLGKRQILGASIGQFAGNSTLVFFLTWFPTYLATTRHMAWIKVGFFAMLPYIAACVGVVAGGLASDFLLRKNGSANLARKLPVVAGLLLASTIVAANFVDTNALVILVMCIAFFGQGMVNQGWTLLTDVAPKNLVGTAAGVFNLCTNLAGIITPLVIGFIVAATGNFFWALGFISAMALLGVVSYVFILGDVKRVEIEP